LRLSYILSYSFISRCIVPFDCGDGDIRTRRGKAIEVGERSPPLQILSSQLFDHLVCQFLGLSQIRKLIEKVIDGEPLLFLAGNIIDDLSLMHHHGAGAQVEGLLHTVGNHEGREVFPVL